MPDKTLDMLKASTNFLQGECTGEIEPWAGRRGPMITAFLKQAGARPGPKGFKTVKEFAGSLLKSLKNSSYYIRFRFTVPDGSGGQKQQLGTLISISADGNLTFACRERINSQFTTDVEKVERANNLAGLVPDAENEDGDAPAIDLSSIAESKVEA